MATLIPGGKLKGTPIEQADDETVRYWFNRISKDLGENPEKNFADKDRGWLAAAKTELVKRGVAADELVMPAKPANGSSNGASRPAGRPANGPQRAASSAAIVQSSDQQLVVGTFGDGQQASQALMDAAKAYHLVTPASVVGRLPEGCEVVISLVQVNPYGAEVYQITGNRDSPKDTDTVGIDRVALDRIAAAAGVSWVYTRRTDDASHPHYCSWEACARFKNFDMSHSDYPANVEIDTREDGDIRGAAAEEIRTKQISSNDKGDKQLLELRKFLTRHAESKAKNRAIAGRGVRRSYKRFDLQKPFAVAKLIFTGHSADPEARREFRQMIGQSFLASADRMFAPAAPPPASHSLHALPQHQPVSMYQLQSPPPIGMSLDQGDGGEVIDEQPEQPAAQPAKPASQPGATAAAAKPVDKSGNPEAEPVFGEDEDLKT